VSRLHEEGRERFKEGKGRGRGEDKERFGRGGEEGSSCPVRLRGGKRGNQSLKGKEKKAESPKFQERKER